MLFTSSIFLYAFLPVVLASFYTLARIKPLSGLLIPFLVLASFVFYGYKTPENILILLGSILVNYAVAIRTHKSKDRKSLWMWCGVSFNLALLFYYKYTNFFFENMGVLSGHFFEVTDIVLPLAISFYTFQQIAYLVDVRQRKVEDTSFKNYLLFVTFFPQLIIGPIVHHKEMMPQFMDKLFGRFSWENFKVGYMYLIAGLIKKVFLSDSCAQIVDSVHADIATNTAVSFADAWIATLAFSFQIYFDFSGYTDMAIGVALMLGIVLPFNFNSPYKAKNIAEFWRRWHITLSRWLRDYLYIPLGGNNRGAARAAINAIIVFFLGGLWHGAAWTFVLWGVVQGIGLSVCRAAEYFNVSMPTIIGIAITFLFATLSWVLFRSASLDNAQSLYFIMMGGHGLDWSVRDIAMDNLPVLVIATVITFALPNTHKLVPCCAELLKKIPLPILIPVMIVIWLSMAAFDLDSSAEFIYFDF